jgi:lysophospholipase L1-like esterase
MRTLITALAICAAVLVAGCSGDQEPSGPNTTGSIDKSVYVAIGNSITAGYQSGALFEEAQAYSFPNLLAQQLGTPFVQPLFPGDGTGARIRLASLTPPTLATGANSLVPPSNIAYAAAYNNLGIPGALISDALDTANIVAKSQSRGNPFFALVLRNQAAFGASIVQQAVSLKPTLVTFWLGNNNVLSYATSGGTNALALFPLGVFDAYVANAIRTLRDSLPDARIVAANIPSVRAIPFFTTVGPQIAPKLAALNVDMWYQRHGEKTVGSGTTRLLGNDALILLTGASFAPYLGQPTAAYYRYVSAVTGVPLGSLIAGVDTTKPFGMHPQNPWPDALLLDNTELSTLDKATQEYNGSILSQVNMLSTTARPIALVDIYAAFNDILANGYNVSGEQLSTAFISGGLFSLDGVHPSSKGAGVIANLFIAAMNRTYGANIPMVDISRIPGIAVPVSKRGIPYSLEWNVPPDVFRRVVQLFQY